MSGRLQKPANFFRLLRLRQAERRLDSPAHQTLPRASLNCMRVPHEYPRIADFLEHIKERERTGGSIREGLFGAGDGGTDPLSAPMPKSVCHPSRKGLADAPHAPPNLRLLCLELGKSLLRFVVCYLFMHFLNMHPSVTGLGCSACVLYFRWLFVR